MPKKKTEKVEKEEKKETKKTKKADTSLIVDDLKDKKILVIVESPNKTQTLTKIFKKLGFKNLQVMASVGHITKIKDNPRSYKNTGIHPDQDFKVDFVVDTKKKDVVSNLKKAADKADIVFLMSDPDREGSAISTHLKEELKIPDKKYYRVVTHEITESGVKKALTEMGKIDKNLSAAAECRQVIDKLIGYSLSPIVRNEINCKSAGRCQSAGLKLIAERENEIKNFKVEKYYDLYLHFKKNSTEFKAKYVGTTKKEVKRIEKIEDVEKVKKETTGKPFFVNSVKLKEINESPKPPFTTSTFQQEANRTYGMPIDMAMSFAQKLFEGIELNGEHVALITYIRTDDTSMSPDFAEDLKKYVEKTHGKKYYAPVKKGTNSEGSQEAHECLRIINLDLPPEKLATYIKDNNLIKIYKMIWERTIMSSMAPAILGDTIYEILNGEHKFVMHSREIIFDGYRKVHVDEEDAITKDEVVKEKFVETEVLKNTKLEEELKETTPPKRYTEASFIKELDKRGIGRPSTFATIVKTILTDDRGYCEVKDKLITPTAKGMELSEYLDKQFPDFINLNYTTELEKKLDLVANGKIKEIDFLNEIFNDLDSSCKKITPTEKVCPNCGRPMARRKGKFGYFFGCTGYPECKTILK